MKILYVVHQFFPEHHTGTERLTLQIAKQIQKMGNFVTVLTYEPNKIIKGFIPLDEHVMKKEYQFETIPVIAFKINEINTDFNIFNDKIIKYLPDIIKKFDIVHFTHPMRLGSVLKVCKEIGTPTVLTLTDNWLLCPTGLLTKNLGLCDGPDEGRKCMLICNYDDKILSRYKDAKYFFDNIDMTFAGCEFLRESFAINEWKNQIELNTFSMDYSYVKPQGEKQELVFGFIGSLIWQKGVHVLIRAFKKISRDDIKLKIYGTGVAGDGTTQRLYALAKGDKRIEFCGTFDYDDLTDVMKEISVLVIPSTYKEIYPLVMQIARAYKKPIIASKVGGMPEVIEHGVNGFLFEMGNSDELSKIIDIIVKDPKLIEKLKEKITFPPSVEEEVFKYMNGYENLLNL